MTAEQLTMLEKQYLDRQLVGIRRPAAPEFVLSALKHRLPHGRGSEVRRDREGVGAFLCLLYSVKVGLQSVLFFESPQELFARVFSELKPRTAVPAIRLEFCKFANANSFVRWDEDGLAFRITDVLEGAPAQILEALAHILLSKLFRRPTPKMYAERYRRYLNRKEMRRSLQLVKQARGRKYVSSPKGDCYDLEAIFEDLNTRYFNGLIARPLLGWSRQPSRSMLGHYDPSHNAIVLSRFLDRRAVAQLAVEYVMFHEMLHLRFPVEHRGARRCVHTPEFKQAEKGFASYREAKELLKRICSAQ